MWFRCLSTLKDRGHGMGSDLSDMCNTASSSSSSSLNLPVLCTFSHVRRDELGTSLVPRRPPQTNLCRKATIYQVIPYYIWYVAHTRQTCHSSCSSCYSQPHGKYVKTSYVHRSPRATMCKEEVPVPLQFSVCNDVYRPGCMSCP